MTTTNGHATDTRARLREARMQLALKKAELQLRALDRRERTLRENWGRGDWNAGVWLPDRLTRSAADTMLGHYSVASDRLHGHNWPFWRSWQEHSWLRASARLICTMSPLAAGALSGLTSFVIGEGYTWRAVCEESADLADAVQATVDEFCERTGWPLLEQELFGRSRRDGEFFLRLFESDDGLDVRTVEPEQVIDDPQRHPNATYGVITDAEDVQQVQSYFVAYDGQYGHGEDVSADEIVHCKVNVDRVIKRGLSDFAYRTHDSLRTADIALTNMAESTAEQASIAFVVQHEVATSGQVQTFVDGLEDYETKRPFGRLGEVESVIHHPAGQRLDIDKGQNYVAPPFAANASGYVEAIGAVLRGVAVRWNAPEWLVSGDASNNNYASSLTAENPFVKTCRRAQAFYKTWFERVIWRAVEVQARRGLVRANGRTFAWEAIEAACDIQCEPPRVEVRDVLQQAQVDQIYVTLGIKSRQTVATEQGLDWEQEAASQEEYAAKFGADPLALLDPVNPQPEPEPQPEVPVASGIAPSPGPAG